jgi:hypothetical protein
MFFFFRKFSEPTQDSIFQSMKDTGDVLLGNLPSEKNFNPIQLSSQVPLWIKRSNSNFLVFLQAYYDWLAKGYGEDGFNVMDISNMFDLSDTPASLLPQFINTYAPDIKGIYEIDEQYRPTPDNIRDTLNNIKNEIYQRKSNEDAFRSLMASLFSMDEEKIDIRYPKRKVLRLNGGMLDWMTGSRYYGITGEYSPDYYSLVGSYLNQGVVQNGKMWQDFSYVLTSGLTESSPYYAEVVSTTLHPAGLLGIYEKFETYSEGGYGVEGQGYEIPKISNYYPYNLTSSSTLPKCTGCTGEFSFPGWYYPTFVYPNWDMEISEKNPSDFGSILIYDFIELKTESGMPSPNDAIGTICNFACGLSGTAQMSWSVDPTEPYVVPSFEETEDYFFFEKTKE